MGRLSKADALIDGAWWPMERLGDAMDRLTGHRTPNPSASMSASEEVIDAWLSTASAAAAHESEHVRVTYAQLEQTLAGARALLLRRRDGDRRFLVILTSSRGTVSLLRPDMSIARVARGSLVAIITAELETSVAQDVNAVLDDAGVAGGRRVRARRELLRRRIGQRLAAEAWALAPRSTASIGAHLRASRIPRHVAIYVVTYIVQYGLWLASWWTVGAWALHGAIDPAWVAAWVLLWLTIVPLQLYCRWAEGEMAILIGRMLKGVVFAGANRLDLDTLRMDGPSRFLGRVLEATVIELGLFNGVFTAIVGGVELIFAAVVLGAGAGGAWHVATLAVWAVLFAAGYAVNHRRRRVAARARLELTHDLVEKMVGYRTRLAQQPRQQRHAGEDTLLNGYYAACQHLDHWMTLVETATARGWILVALIMLVPSVLRGTSAVSLAVSVGGILLADRAFGKWIGASGLISDAANAWAEVRPMFAAAAALPVSGDANAVAALASSRAEESTRVLSVHDVAFGYRTRSGSVAQGWSLTVNAGDRLLVEGRSGSGKSTLCALLSGAREPSRGVVLLRGLDMRTVGAMNWRRRVVSVPQFHENHVIAETFAFNLLMGRRWPCTADDLREATIVCGELGLGDLLKKMPAGMFQLVGDTGWQLSHGEKSRLFVARALLQDPEVMLLDESFAALDPNNLQLALDCVLRRAKTAIVVAHP
jgi:ABC-type multidrug transport system fused ATPase/permease subunit